MTPLEKFAAAYWDAFRNGFLKVGGDASYPMWKESNDPVKEETMRCLRHAMETLKKLPLSHFVDDDIAPEQRDGIAKMNRGKFVAVLERAFPDKPIAREQTHVTASEVLLDHSLKRRQS